MKFLIEVVLPVYVIIALISTFNASLHWGMSRDYYCNQKPVVAEIVFHGRFIYCALSQELK